MSDLYESRVCVYCPVVAEINVTNFFSPMHSVPLYDYALLCTVEIFLAQQLAFVSYSVSILEPTGGHEQRFSRDSPQGC